MQVMRRHLPLPLLYACHGGPLPLPLLYASHGATLTFTLTLCQSWGDPYIYPYFMLVMVRPLPLALLYASQG
jgi:hypothetical protein